jgi:hypothetical protein
MPSRQLFGLFGLFGLYTLAGGVFWNVVPYNTNKLGTSRMIGRSKNKPSQYWSQARGRQRRRAVSRSLTNFQGEESSRHRSAATKDVSITDRLVAKTQEFIHPNLDVR